MTTKFTLNQNAHIAMWENNTFGSNSDVTQSMLERRAAVLIENKTRVTLSHCVPSADMATWGRMALQEADITLAVSDIVAYLKNAKTQTEFERKLKTVVEIFQEYLDRFCI